MKKLTELLPTSQDLAQTGSRELRKQEPTESLIGDEKTLALAVVRKKISEYENDERLNDALRFAMLYVGLREANLPTDFEASVLRSYIKRNYGNHSPEEVKLAFEMAVAGNLDLPYQNVMAYENFSIEYFSRIMNSYRRWAAQAVRQNEHLIFEKPKQRQLTAEEKLGLDLAYAYLIALNEWRKPCDLNFFIKTENHENKNENGQGLGVEDKTQTTRENPAGLEGENLRHE